MKKALMYASVASMIQQFNMENIKLLKELGYKVDVACNFEFGSTISKERIEKLKEELKAMDVDYYHIPVPRKTTDFKNLKESYKITKDLMNKEKYDLIHCHSPIGGIICRLANKNSICYDNTKMIYTAHGFHFFKGNNLIKNFIFRNIEKLGGRYTDVLITINKEDYEAAKNFKLRKNGKVEYVPGVGIDVDKIMATNGDKAKLLEELKIPEDSFLLLSVGELSVRKNHQAVIKALPTMSDKIHYLICGQGNQGQILKDLGNKLNVESRIHFLGYRSDVIYLMKSSDIFVFPSLQEGLPVALMEAIACGIPCVASNIRGNADLMDNDKGVVLNLNEFTDKLNNSIKVCKKEKDKYSLNYKFIEKYSKCFINDFMKKLYTNI